ncbi:MAG: EamA family transporter [Planctomycetes bacterium]|nr:EamA family transporter [Planctomycetota bacterium]
MQQKHENALPALAFCACTLIWSSTWLAIKIGNDDLPPMNGAALRFLVATAILLIIQSVCRISMPRGARQWGVVAFVGVVLVGFDYGLIYWAEQFLPTGLTSVLFATMPLFTLALARFMGLEKLTIRKTAGILLAIAGVGMLSRERLQMDPDALPAAAGVLGAALCSAATTTVTKKFGKDLHPVSLNGWSAAVGALILYTAAFVHGEGVRFPQSFRGWLAVSYLAVFGSVIAFLLYFWLLRRWDSTRCGMVSVLTPVLAIVIGAAVAGEKITIWLLVGGACVLAGVFIAMRPTIKLR